MKTIYLFIYDSSGKDNHGFFLFIVFFRMTLLARYLIKTYLFSLTLVNKRLQIAILYLVNWMGN